jgi:hypothetical protein
MPEHYIREKPRKLSTTALLQLIDPTGIDGFYPTPDDLVHEMVVGLDWYSISSVLEPSAGKGDLVDSLLKWRSIATSRHDDYCGFHVDCIEINPDLRAILRGKNYRVIHDDFMTFRSAKRYDLIIMNPDFRVADKHLLKALDMQAHGGMVICLLNAATLKNPCTRMRQQLVERLNELDAEVTYFDNAFTDAERPTSVSVAMVKVVVPHAKAERSDIFERMKKAVEAEEYAPEDVHDLAPAEFMERFVRMFDVEVAAGVELIRQYNAMRPHILSSIPDSQSENQRWGDNNPILMLCTPGQSTTSYSGVSINKYLQETRRKYWNALFSKKEFIGKLTSDLAEKYRSMVDELSNYDFTMFNIKRILTEMNSEIYRGVEDAIMKIFDKLSNKHSWRDSDDNTNIHYYNGWAHNKAHKINKKVIIPSYGVFPDWAWARDTFKVYEAYEKLADIEKCFNYLDGCTTKEVDLYAVLERANAEGRTKKIHCKFFDVTFYRKGTTHITFTNQALLDKFNIYCSQKRNWLPPSYGKVRYDDMDQESRDVIDSFQGREAYEEVMRNREYYLVSSQNKLSLPEAV